MTVIFFCCFCAALCAWLAYSNYKLALLNEALDTRNEVLRKACTDAEGEWGITESCGWITVRRDGVLARIYSYDNEEEREYAMMLAEELCDKLNEKTC